MTLSRRELLATSAALAATSAAASAASVQDVGEPEPTPSPEEELLDKLQGGWILRELDAPDLDDTRRQEKGYMVIGGSFLAVELQLAWDAAPNDEWINGFFQSGVSRIWLERSNVLVARGLIGATTDEDYGLEIEAPGKERRYKLRFSGKNELSLTMEDGPQFFFKRLQNSAAKRKAFSPSPKTRDR